MPNVQINLKFDLSPLWGFYFILFYSWALGPFESVGVSGKADVVLIQPAQLNGFGHPFPVVVFGLPSFPWQLRLPALVLFTAAGGLRYFQDAKPVIIYYFKSFGSCVAENRRQTVLYLLWLHWCITSFLPALFNRMGALGKRRRISDR